MTDQSGGARSRRDGRGPGWLLLTALLVLAILASSTLVFTNKVELLRLAVVLSLWAAVMAAFVTVVYRRQSEVAQARARDMKFVYDLQLDREISARREYELSVETQLRRQLSREVRTQAADEMSALRAELASLRSQLEVMLGTDLGHRPALERERMAVAMPAAPDRVESSRVTVTEEYVSYSAEELVTESPILDVPEEPLASVVEEDEADEEAEEAIAPPFAPPIASPIAPPIAPPPPVQYAPPPVQYAPPPIQYAPLPQPEAPWRPPEVRLGRHSTSDGGQRPEGFAPPEPPRGRHWVPPEPPPATPAPVIPAPVALGRHRGTTEPAVDQTGIGQTGATEPLPEQPPADEPEGQHADGQALSDLLSRFNMAGPVGGGGRRRRDD